MIATSLILMLGIFWIIDLAPLVFFIGTGVVYGVLSSHKKRDKAAPLSSTVPHVVTQEKTYE